MINHPRRTMLFTRLCVCAALATVMFAAAGCNTNSVAPATSSLRIDSFAPRTVRRDAEIVITGAGFNATRGENVVGFCGTTASSVVGGTVDSVVIGTPDRLFVRVPEAAHTGVIRVVLGANDVAISSDTLFVGPDSIPHLTTFAPSTGVPGAHVVFTGTNFDTVAAHTVVTFGGVAAAVVSASAHQLVVRIPCVSGAAPLWFAMNYDTLLTRVPFTVQTQAFGIDSVNPTAGEPDQAVVVVCHGLPEDVAGFAVAFGGVPAVIDSMRANRIYTHVPGGASSGMVTITSACGAREQSQAVFTVYPQHSRFVRAEIVVSKISGIFAGTAHKTGGGGTCPNEFGYTTSAGFGGDFVFVADSDGCVATQTDSTLSFSGSNSASASFLFNPITLVIEKFSLRQQPLSYALSGQGIPTETQSDGTRYAKLVRGDMPADSIALSMDLGCQSLMQGCPYMVCLTQQTTDFADSCSIVIRLSVK